MTRPEFNRRASPVEPAVPGRSPHQLHGGTPPLTRLHIGQLWQEAHAGREWRAQRRRAAWRPALCAWLRRLAARLEAGQPEVPAPQPDQW